ncbi:MAG: TlpA family protein disulfide reductase [Sandaracinaceae bacterium]|nr:TlpA family protein disulfide reductase [Sandaracinaceae bacterium]
MTRRERVLWTLGFFGLVAAIVAAIALARTLGLEGRPSNPLVGTEAPTLSLPRLDGPPLELTSLRGDVVLLDFWASWCGPCRQSIPALNSVHSRYQGRIQMFGVNLDHGLDAAGVARAHRAFGAEFPSVRDSGGAAQSAFGVTSIPTLVLIDRAGVIRYVARGVPDPGDVGDAIDDLL